MEIIIFKKDGTKITFNYRNVVLEIENEDTIEYQLINGTNVTFKKNEDYEK